MSKLLIKTKFFIPVARSHLINRPRLMRKLNLGLQGRLTLVSAPAGFGKTTLIADWCQHLNDAGAWLYSWLALDENDNDLTHFFTYLTATINRKADVIPPVTEELLQTNLAHNQNDFMVRLLNDLADMTQPLMLVLDDYHYIHNAEIHSALEFLLTHAPPAFHLAIITRVDPPFSLVKLRARHQITEIRQHDLRFSHDEAANFLNQLMSLDLDETAIQKIEGRTEGWIAGLQMAALSLQGSKDQDRFIAEFSGTHRYIFDYLAEEVLAGQPAEIRAFLLETAVLERLCAPLCDALLGRTHSQLILEKLEEANLFLIPLDDTRHWYRYHHLFADLLRQILRKEMPDQELDLHSRASRWHETDGEIDVAVEHALKAQEVERAAALMEPLAHSMAYRMENERLGRWVSALPDRLLMEYPGIVFPYAITLTATYQFNKYSAYLDKMERAALANIDKPAARSILGQVEILRCIDLHIHGQYEAALTAVEDTREQLRQYNLPVRRWELISIEGYALNHVSRRRRESLQYLEEAIGLGEADQGSIGATLCRTFMANTLIQHGRLQEASRHLEKAARAAVHGGQPQLHAIFPAALQARLHYEWDELDLAAGQMSRYLPFSQIAGFTMDPLDTVYVYVMLPLAQGKVEEARDHMNRAWADFQALEIGSDFAQRLLAIQALFRLRINQRAGAVTWAESVPPFSEQTFRPLDALSYLVKVRVLLAEKKAGAAQALLNVLRQWATAGQMNGLLLEINLLQALAAQTATDEPAALTYLTTAIQLAAPENYTRIFLDEGEPMRQLLTIAYENEIGDRHPYIATLLRAFPESQLASPIPSIETPTPNSQANLLSSREVEVLRLIAAGLTNKEIAAELIIATSTAKRHTINIYNKLDVSNRAEATARAFELGLANSQT